MPRNTISEDQLRNEKASRLDVLAESFRRRKDSVLWESGGRKMWGGDLIVGLDKKPGIVERDTLAMLENVMRESNMQESTSLVNIGSFEKWALPMVRAIFPNLILQDLVSVQPMDGPTTLIFWMKFLYGKTKGRALAGQDMLANPHEDYASEQIDAEVLATGTGAVANYTGTLQWTPVQPGAVVITAGALTVTDDGNGNLIGDIAAGTNSIDYTTGAFDVTFSANVGASVQVIASYKFDMEANVNQPEIDMTLVSKPVKAEPMTLIARWSEYAQQDLLKLHGDSAEGELTKAQGAEIKAMIERRVLSQILRNASLTGATWSSSPGTGVSQLDHYQSFVTRLIENSNQIYGATKRARGNWMVVSLEVANVVEALAATGRFVPDMDLNSTTTGPHYIGMLDGRWRVYKDPTFATNQYLMGYKNTDNMYEVGCVYAPYIMLFASPVVAREYFQSSRGLGSRYASDVVDGNFYLIGSIS